MITLLLKQNKKTKQYCSIASIHVESRQVYGTKENPYGMEQRQQRKQKQQQKQEQEQTQESIKNLSLVRLCILLGVSFCISASLIQLYVHSGITSNISDNNLDDDNTLYVGGDHEDDKLLMKKNHLDKHNKNHNVDNLRHKGHADTSKQQSKDISIQLKSNANQSENKNVNQNTKKSQTLNENTKETPTKVEKVNEFRGEIIDCGCPTTCTPNVLLTGNAHFTCKTRITKLMSKYNFTQHQACEMSSKSSKDEAEDKDGLKPCPMQCHPKTCHSMPKYGIDCGCPHTCDERALHKRNSQFLCKDRISHLMNKKNLPELEACALASQTAYNFNDTQNIDINTPCEYECHPEICKDMDSKPVLHDVSNINLPKEMPFTKYDGVVIVTKVLSSENINLLIQMLCLFNTAYNRFVYYDIIVFTTIPFPPEDVRKVQEMAHPAKLQVVTEGKSLEEHLNEMTPEERQALNKRCRVKSNENLTWSHHCEEDNSEHVSSLGYAWQAEFRSFHMWTHEAMKPYKYMMWMDADAMCTKTWDVDPMKVMIENDLVLLFDHFPGGFVRGETLKKKMLSSYNEAVCGVSLDEDKGILKREKCKKKDQIPSIHQVYGFHHITNLDVYRKERHQRFLKELITNEYKFSRLWDDQLAVTFPAIMEDPSRCWDYQSHGLNVSIHHNGRVDGKKHPKYLSYLNYWANDGKYLWPAARAMCDGLVTEIC